MNYLAEPGGAGGRAGQSRQNSWYPARDRLVISRRPISRFSRQATRRSGVSFWMICRCSAVIDRITALKKWCFALDFLTAFRGDRPTTGGYKLRLSTIQSHCNKWAIQVPMGGSLAVRAMARPEAANARVASSQRVRPLQCGVERLTVDETGDPPQKDITGLKCVQ